MSLDEATGQLFAFSTYCVQWDCDCGPGSIAAHRTTARLPIFKHRSPSSAQDAVIEYCQTMRSDGGNEMELVPSWKELDE